jgi:hypothetical protein
MAKFRGLLMPAPGAPFMLELSFGLCVPGAVRQTLHNFPLLIAEFGPTFHALVVAMETSTSGRHFNIPSV